MRVLKQLFNFYINSSIHVALAVVSLTWITLMEYGISQDEPLLFFVFFAAVSGYNFVKYFGMAHFHHRSLATWLKAIQVFSFFSFLLMIYFTLKLSTTTLFYITGFGVLTFFYAMPILPKKKRFKSYLNLRSIGGFKVYVIALVWMGVTVFLPLKNNNYEIKMDVLLTAIQRFVFIIILMLPFEIRDLRYDSLKLGTIPQKIGITKTKLVGVLLLVLYCFLEFFKEEINPVYTSVLVLIGIITAIFLLFSEKEQGNYYCSFWVEGVPVFWAILWYLASLLQFP